MKSKFLFLFLLVVEGFNLFSQQIDYHEIPHRVIHIDEDDNYSDYIIGQPNHWYIYGDNTLRLIEFDVTFQQGTNYVLTGNQATYQTYWNKVMSLETLQNFGDKNSLRIGWRYDIASQKIELGFYGHMNHTGDDAGREFASLGVFVSQDEPVHIEMVFSKFDFYVRANNSAIRVYRDIFSWSPEGEHTQIQLSSYVGDQDQWEAPAPIDILVTNIKTDRQSYLNNKEQNHAPIMKFMNTAFPSGTQIDYVADNYIETSLIQEGGSSQATRLPYAREVENQYSFTIVEPGAHITMTAPTAYLYPGTTAENTEFVVNAAVKIYAAPIESNNILNNVDSIQTLDLELLDESAPLENGKEKQSSTEIHNSKKNEITQNLKITAFPNPANENVTFFIKSDSDYEIQVIDISGRSVFQSELINSNVNSYKIDFSYLSDGFYICNVKTINGDSEIYKLIKE